MPKHNKKHKYRSRSRSRSRQRDSDSAVLKELQKIQKRLSALENSKQKSKDGLHPPSPILPVPSTSVSPVPSLGSLPANDRRPHSVAATANSDSFCDDMELMEGILILMILLVR